MHIWIMELIEGYGYIVYFILMIVENIFPPIPSEVILPFAGIYNNNHISVFNRRDYCFYTGMLFGRLCLYYLGRLLTPKRI